MMFYIDLIGCEFKSCLTTTALYCQETDFDDVPLSTGISSVYITFPVL